MDVIVMIFMQLFLGAACRAARVGGMADFALACYDDISVAV